jgi:hypothetical protein
MYEWGGPIVNVYRLSNTLCQLLQRVINNLLQIISVHWQSYLQRIANNLRGTCQMVADALWLTVFIIGSSITSGSDTT